MKLLLLFAFSFLLSPAADAQASPRWTLSHNGKVLLKTSTEDESKNTLALRSAELKKKGLLRINYSDPTQQKGWVRTIMYTNPQGEELLKTTGASSQVQNARLKTLLTKAGSLLVYSISLPSDPAEAAVVRVRRVHLCTLTLR